MARLTTKKTFTHRGDEYVVYFREMNVVDTQKLLKGQRAAVGEDGKLRAELDYGQEYERSLLQVQLTLCDEEGKLAYANTSQLQNVPTTIVAHYIRLSKEAEKEFADTTGN